MTFGFFSMKQKPAPPIDLEIPPEFMPTNDPAGDAAFAKKMFGMIGEIMPDEFKEMGITEASVDDLCEKIKKGEA